MELLRNLNVQIETMGILKYYVFPEERISDFA
jgi:hypothetical protein